MLDQETSQILESLTVRSIGSREGVSLGEILSSDLPRGVKAYLRAEVHQWLSDDLARAPHLSRLKAPVPGLSRQVDVFLRTLAEGYVFTRTQFLSTLENAVHFALNYLCRPHWTIRNFLFTDHGTISFDMLHTKLQYVSDYQYLVTILEKICRQREWKQISEPEFRALLLDIDARVTREHTLRELALLTKPIFDFVLLRNAPPDAPIPLRPILAFFEDKEMHAVKEYIEKLMHVRGRSDISLGELSAVLEDMLGAAAPDTSPTPSHEDDSEKPPAPPLEERVPIFVTVDAPESATTKAPEGDHPGEGTPTGSLPVIQQEDHTESLTDIRELISPDQRQRFIRIICGRDDAFFEALLSKFNGFKTWGDASNYLHDVFAIHGIDPFSPTAIEFTDVLQKRFPAGGAEQR